MTENDNDVDIRINNIIIKETYADWIVLSFIHSNLTNVNFHNFLEDLAYNYKDKNKKWS